VCKIIHKHADQSNQPPPDKLTRLVICIGFALEDSSQSLLRHQRIQSRLVARQKLVLTLDRFPSRIGMFLTTSISFF
jgi:hypothetical protein